MTTNRPSLLFIELNEFNPEFLAREAARLKLRHLQYVLQLRHSTTGTADAVETQGLDPWAQWVGVHSGHPTAVHTVKRLGDTKRQQLPQLWHKTADRGYRWGVWGVMNAPMGDRKGAGFFMPDPWSFEEKAHPERLNDLLALPRYVARNYLEVDYGNAFTAMMRLARFFLPPRRWGVLARFLVQAVKACASAGVNVHSFTTLLDHLSVLVFIQLRRKEQPDLSIIFLNHIAHLQHHFWQAGEELHPQMKLGLELCDAMLGLLLADRKEGEALVVMNAFRQHNVAGQGYHCYRQRNPQEAVEAIGIAGGKVEQNMTNDGTILFESAAETERAQQVLEVCVLNDGQKVFFTERQGENRLFFQVDIKRKVAEDAVLLCGERKLPFRDIFEHICERTGAHVQEGDIFAEGIALPETLQNHEIFDHILKHFPARA